MRLPRRRLGAASIHTADKGACVKLWHCMSPWGLQGVPTLLEQDVGISQCGLLHMVVLLLVPLHVAVLEIIVVSEVYATHVPEQKRS